MIHLRPLWLSSSFVAAVFSVSCGSEARPCTYDSWITSDEYSSSQLEAYPKAMAFTDHAIVVGYEQRELAIPTARLRERPRGNRMFVAGDALPVYSGGRTAANGVYGASDALYVVGVGGTGSLGEDSHWLTMREPTNGAFSIVDDFIAGGSGGDNQALSVTEDRNGVVYVAGYGSEGSTSRWTVRTSVGGTTWSTADQFHLAPSRRSIAYAVTASRSNTASAYVVGSATAEDGAIHWIVRKSGNGGATWETVDDFVHNGSPEVVAQAVAMDSTEAVWVVGYATAADGMEHWLVRRSDSQGRNFQTLEDFVDVEGARAAAIAIDRDDNVFVAGLVNVNRVLQSAWVVRRTTDVGVSWTTADRLDDPSMLKYVPAAMVAGDDGTIHVTGVAQPNDGWPIWTTRTTTCE